MAYDMFHGPLLNLPSPYQLVLGRYLPSLSSQGFHDFLARNIFKQ